MIIYQKLFSILICLVSLMPYAADANEVDSPQCKDGCQIPSIFLDKPAPPVTQPVITQSATDMATDGYHPTLAPLRLNYKPRGIKVELKVQVTQVPHS